MNVPHIEDVPVEATVDIDKRDLDRAVGAGIAVEALLKLLTRAGGGMKLAQERHLRRPHPEGIDDYTERKYGGKQQGLHLVVRDWETNFCGHVRNGTNVDIRAWGFADEGVVRYWEREQWAIGEAPLRRAGIAIERGNKRLAEAVLRVFGLETPPTR